MDLPFAKPEELHRIIREIIQVLGKDGGYIVAPTHAMPRDIPAVNVVAFLECVSGQVNW